MNNFLHIMIILILLCRLFKNDYEGFFNMDECNPRNIITDEKCNSKWGLPDCVKWEKKSYLDDILKSNTQESHRSYMTNHYLYEVDHTESDEPKPINSTFFS